MKLKAQLLFFLLLFSCFSTFSQGKGGNYHPPSVYGGNVQFKQLLALETDYTSITKNKGKVNVIFSILEDGTVKQISVFNYSDIEFVTEAKKVAQKIKWYPATRFGSKENGQVLLTFKFNKKRHLLLQKKLPLLDTLISRNEIIFSKNVLDVKPQPIYPQKQYGGIIEYVLKNFKYPENALKYSISGKVKVEFIIEPKGYVSNMRIVKQLGGGIDVEITKIINKLFFTPGIKDGKYVRTLVRYEFDIIMKSRQDTTN